jgi:hypothetical protein
MAHKSDIDLKNLTHNYAEEVFTDLQDKLQEGEYQPGKVYPQQFPDDISDIVENVLFLQGAEEVTFRVRKDTDGYHIVFEVISRH